MTDAHVHPAARSHPRSRRLLGRRGACETVERLVAGVRAGHGQVLVLRGEAGMGKTAVLDYALERSAGCRVARAAGVESEAELAFAGLQQLCAPMLELRDRLPPPQRDALETAFGLSGGASPDRFLVGLAVLGLVAEMAADEPLVCLVDDAQWLDQMSAQTLAFVARRLRAERVALLFAVREPSEGRDFEGLPELRVSGLGDGDARALLDSVITGPLDERVRDRIVAETHGNPLALLEMPRGLTPEELAGGFGLPDAAALTGRIEESFRRRLMPLPRGDAAAAVGRGGRARRRSHARAACGRPARCRARRGGAGGGGRTGRLGGLDAVSPSACAVRGLPRGVAEGAADRARGARGGERSGRGSGSSRVAPRPGDVRVRRGRRRRARALGRSGTRPAAVWRRRPRSCSVPPS